MTIQLRMSKNEYIKYVNALRQHFTIRIEVSHKGASLLDHEYTAATLKNYLYKTLSVSGWCMQDSVGYNGLHYVWFMHSADALAFALIFNGKVV